MTLDEYFGDWMKVIDRTELNNVMAKIGQEYRRKPLCPAQSDVFRAYVLFDRQAQTFKPYINDRFNHIIEIEHPAYFARSGTKMPHQLFVDISNKVKEIYGVPIKWYEEY